MPAPNRDPEHLAKLRDFYVEDAVRAGMPAMARDVSTTPFYFDEYLVKEPSRTVLVPMRGDSMADSHIDDGDLAVVERGSEASVGDFVVAIVDGDYTLKELVLEQGRYPWCRYRVTRSWRLRCQQVFRLPLKILLRDASISMNT